MGRAGFHAGGVHAQNLYGGSVDVTTDSSGDGSATVTFPKPMKNIPKVVATIAESITTGYTFITTKTNANCVVNIDGCNLTSDTVTVDVFAFDDSFR